MKTAESLLSIRTRSYYGILIDNYDFPFDFWDITPENQSGGFKF